MRAALVLSLAGLTACSSQQLYAAGQAWQRQECSKIQDTQDRNRCMASAQASYEDYRRQSDAARSKRE